MDAAPELTKRQQQVLDYIRSEVSEKGYPPSVREIGEALGLSSSSTVHSHLSALEAKGFIHRDPSKPRALVIIDLESQEEHSPVFTEDDYARTIRSLPLVGQVAAGVPILAEQNIEETIPLPVEIVGDSSSFLLKVRGESMIEAGIMSGDYVVVREQPSANNGEIVVAMIDDEATVKTFYKELDHIKLQPENSSMEPIYTRDAVILGKVVALFRTI